MKKAVIFDVDDTLFDTTGRKTEALHRLAVLPKFQHIPNITCLRDLPKAKHDYGIDASLKFCKIPETHHGAIKSQFFEIFLSNDGMYHNGKVLGRPLVGAKTAVNTALKRGYHVIYLTGRHHDEENNDSMAKGTRDEFRTYGFPLDDRVTLIMKKPMRKVGGTIPARKVNDAEFKQSAIDTIKRTYDVVATVDDGMKNVEVFVKNFPTAQNFGLTVNFPCKQFPKEAVCIGKMTNHKLKRALR